MFKQDIEQVAVLGAGTMGSGIAAHLANAGVRTLLLDVVPRDLTRDESARGLTRDCSEVRNRLARGAVRRLSTAEPAPLFVPDRARYIETGNIEDHLDRIAEADWIIEAVVEDPRIKLPLLERVDAARRPGAIVSTNTSGIPVNFLARGRSEDFRQHWLGTHFFNPPRYARLIELIPGNDTLPEVTQRLQGFLERDLGKSIVIAKDTPNFIANRIGLFSFMHTLHAMMRHGWDVAEVDALTGPLLGRPKSATFRTADIVGIDTLVHILRHTYEVVRDDEARATYEVPPLLEEMVRRGWTGSKGESGFYRKSRGEGGPRVLALDWRRMEYTAPKPPPEAFARAGEIEEIGQRIRYLLRRPDRIGHFAWEVLAGMLDYSARRIPEIADDIVTVDRALRWGYGWEIGPFETWDALGVKRLATRIEKEGREVPPIVQQLLASGRRSFYQRSRGNDRFFDTATARTRPVARKPAQLQLSDLHGPKHVVRRNAAASLLDLGDGVACLEFQTRLNVIGRETLAMLRQSLEVVERDFAALLIANQGESFCAGANLRELLAVARAGAFPEIELMVRAFQEITRQLRYLPRPVVVAPFGLTLGGGCEIALAADRVHGSSETYMGLVEVGVGLVPAGGGTLEMLARHLERRPAESLDGLPYVELAFRTIGRARVSTSALDARKLLYLRETDTISMNRDGLVADAAEAARRLARDGYRPPVPRTDLVALGEPALSRLSLELHLLERAGFISAHDHLVGKHLARILAGGDHPGPRPVTEAAILDLECEAFLSLVGERKTQERMEHVLRTGKPLRN